MPRKLTVAGNCQADDLARCLRVMLPGTDVKVANYRMIRNGQIDFLDVVKGSDALLVQAPSLLKVCDALDSASSEAGGKVVYFPAISFSGFHPDLIRATHDGDAVMSPLNGNNSAITLYAWMHSLSVDKTVSLFRDEVYSTIGFYDHWAASKQAYVQGGKDFGLDLSQELEILVRSGCFMHCTIHPRLQVMAGLARALVDSMNLKAAVRFPENYLVDLMFDNVVWPVYPEIAGRLGVTGEYLFKLRTGKDRSKLLDTFTLDEFIERSFQLYSELNRDLVESERFRSKKFQLLKSFFSSRPKQAVSDNPYRSLPDYNFWRRSIANVPASDVDPVVNPRFAVASSDKVATAGSCFAQHISRRLASSGHHFLLAESGSELDADTRARRNYGVYSARYGNIYTTRQLVQLFERAYGSFQPKDAAWRRSDGSWIDPFRPEIEPEGFASFDALILDRDSHLAAVRHMFETLNIFVFTLGLTEGWRAKADGAIFPLAPGVIGADINAAEYEFVNFSAIEIAADLDCFLARLRSVNPRARAILTVSPVPLVATYENRHVLVSTTASKAALHVAADMCRRKHDFAEYFPSFEIITGNFNRGAYYDEDLRTVKSEGVDHVMRIFMKHYSERTKTQSRPATIDASLAAELLEGRGLVCEEELLDSRTPT